MPGVSDVAVVSAGAALVGAVWGVLLPTLVYRYAVLWPDGEPRPPWRRACATCSEPLPPWWRPSLSRLSVRCRSCGARLGPSRWLTVPLSAGVCGLLGAVFGARTDLPAFMLLALLGVLLGVVDAAVLRLPDPLVRATAVAGVVMLTVPALLSGQPNLIVRAFAAAVVCGIAYGAFALLPGSPLGYGDAKLGVVLGFFLGWLGWSTVLAGLVFAPIANAPILLGLIATGRAGRKTLVPYGPAMLVGALAAIVVSVLRQRTHG